MTTIRTLSTHRSTSHSTLARAADRMYRSLATAWTVYRNRRQVRRIADLDDHLLRDIGLTRADVAAAEAMPIYTDPTARLAITARGEWSPVVMPTARRAPEWRS